MKNNKRTFAVRQRTINIRVTSWEHAMIKNEADHLGLSVSAYLLGLALGFEYVGAIKGGTDENQDQD